MKLETSLSNHEIWHTCQSCKQEFDQRKHPETCPYCGESVYFNRKMFFSSVGISAGYVFVILLFLFLMSSCSSATHFVRKYHNRQEQLMQQSNQPMTYSINWNRRPKGHHPFQFLQ